MPGSNWHGRRSNFNQSVIKCEGDEMYERDETAREFDARINELAAELTSRVYPLLLSQGLKDTWLASQLTLWALLSAAVKEWAGRWRLASLKGNSEGLRNFVAEDIASRTFVILEPRGSGRPPHRLRIAVATACCSVLRGDAQPRTRNAQHGEQPLCSNSVKERGLNDAQQRIVDASVMATL